MSSLHYTPLCARGGLFEIESETKLLRCAPFLNTAVYKPFNCLYGTKSKVNETLIALSSVDHFVEGKETDSMKLRKSTTVRGGGMVE